jgi:hypothetical protein
MFILGLVINMAKLLVSLVALAVVANAQMGSGRRQRDKEPVAVKSDLKPITCDVCQVRARRQCAASPRFRSCYPRSTCGAALAIISSLLEPLTIHAALLWAVYVLLPPLPPFVARWHSRRCGRRPKRSARTRPSPTRVRSPGRKRRSAAPSARSHPRCSAFTSDTPCLLPPPLHPPLVGP